MCWFGLGGDLKKNPTNVLSRGGAKTRGGRFPKAGNQHIAGGAASPMPLHPLGRKSAAQPLPSGSAAYYFAPWTLDSLISPLII